jgi:hypothetical protein
MRAHRPGGIYERADCRRYTLDTCGDFGSSVSSGAKITSLSGVTATAPVGQRTPPLEAGRAGCRSHLYRQLVDYGAAMLPATSPFPLPTASHRRHRPSGGDLIAVGASSISCFYVSQRRRSKALGLTRKAVGVSRFGATTDFAIQMCLRKYGLEPIWGADHPDGGLLNYRGAREKPILRRRHVLSHGAGGAAGRDEAAGEFSQEEIPCPSGLRQPENSCASAGRRPRPRTRYGRAVHFMHTRKEVEGDNFAPPRSPIRLCSRAPCSTSTTSAKSPGQARGDSGDHG